MLGTYVCFLLYFGKFPSTYPRALPAIIDALVSIAAVITGGFAACLNSYKLLHRYSCLVFLHCPQIFPH